MSRVKKYKKCVSFAPQLSVVKVIFNEKATIVLFNDGTKSVVNCDDWDTFDWEKGIAMAIAKKALGNSGNYYNTFKKWQPEGEFHSGFMSPDRRKDILKRRTKEVFKKLTSAEEELKKQNDNLLFLWDDAYIVTDGLMEKV